MITTGTSSTTTAYGATPCPHCGERVRYTMEFHGYWLTVCVACGEEL
jgi:predicted RNA-binding Zn-ribbon protein involved in translation (DUF1610 family)